MRDDFDISRRHLLAGAAAAIGSSLMPRAAFALGTAQVGDAGVSILSDGNLVLPLDFVFPDAPREEMLKLLADTGQNPDALTPDCNVTLVKSGDRTILFDVGAGPNFMPTAGSVLDDLEAAGFAPGDITDVVFTHAHPDHLWGLVDDFDELIYANATYHMNQAEWDYWRADDTLEKTPDARKSFVVGAQNRLEYLADRINLFAYGAEVLPGLEAVDTSGHTQGHTSFVVHSGNDSVMIVGDAVTNAAISFEHPEWPSGSDHDTEQGIKTRKLLLDRLVTDQMKIIGYHMPHPGLGMVERNGNAFRFAVS